MCEKLVAPREGARTRTAAAEEPSWRKSQAGALEAQARDIKGVKVLAAHVDGSTAPQLRTLVDSLRNKWKTAVVVLATVEGLECLDRQRRHQGSDLESPCRETGRSRRAGGRRKRRRPAGYGGSRRQGSVGAACRAGAGLRSRSRGCCRTWKRSRRSRRRRGPHGPGLRHRAEAPRRRRRPARQRLRRQFALSLPDQPGVLHHAGAAGDRRHPDDVAEREAGARRSA